MYNFFVYYFFLGIFALKVLVIFPVICLTFVITLSCYLNVRSSYVDTPQAPHIFLLYRVVWLLFLYFRTSIGDMKLVLIEQQIVSSRPQKELIYIGLKVCCILDGYHTHSQVRSTIYASMYSIYNNQNENWVEYNVLKEQIITQPVKNWSSICQLLCVFVCNLVFCVLSCHGHSCQGLSRNSHVLRRHFAFYPVYAKSCSICEYDDRTCMVDRTCIVDRTCME